ncbi:probable methyltransferase-like protein 24 [Amphiura filiformis]|uniref:probable methyltransferase-like protein 24 n=1 Tax=Amphiura filiformis TaxID=82378 RepID=UPI003B2151DB
MPSLHLSTISPSVFMISRPFSKFLRLSVVMAICLFFTMLQVEIRRMVEVASEDEFQRTLDMQRVVSYSNGMTGDDDNRYHDPDLLYIDLEQDQRHRKRLINRIIPRFNPGKKMLLSEKVVNEDSMIQPTYDESAMDKSFLGVPLQPWANSADNFDAEAKRFLKCITTTQTLCNDIRDIGRASNSEEWPLRACYDSKNGDGGGCVVYSFGPAIPGSSFDVDIARQGCEVHVFNPTSKNKVDAFPDKSIFPHEYSLDWRAATVRGPSSSPWIPKKLSGIMAELGHDKIDILQADLQGTEWKILESLIADKTLQKIRQLILKIHIHWGGFEVQGTNADIARFWYSLIKQMDYAGFKIFYSYSDRTKGPQTILGKRDYNASSTYTLGWLNNDWR